MATAKRVIVIGVIVASTGALAFFAYTRLRKHPSPKSGNKPEGSTEKSVLVDPQPKDPEELRKYWRNRTIEKIAGERGLKTAEEMAPYYDSWALRERDVCKANKGEGAVNVDGYYFYCQ